MVETIYTIPSVPRLALLADFHNGDPASILSSLHAHRPSLICIAGDILYGSHPVDDISPLVSQANVLPFLRSCADIAPTYMSLGNHEWMLDGEDLETLAATGITVLDNSWTRITVDGKDVSLGGLTSGYVTDYRSFRASQDTTDRYPKKENLTGIGGAVTAVTHKPDIGWLDEYSASPGYHILLCHHPEYYPLIPASVDLVLSGHVHGGQWRLFGRGVWSPGQGWFPKWTKGVYGRMVVSAGLSNTTWVPRLFNPTEIVYVEQ